MKGSKKVDLAYKFINIMFDPAVQAEVATLKKGSPVVSNAKLDPEIAKLPGVFSRPSNGRARPSSSTTSCAPRRLRSGASGSQKHHELTGGLRGGTSGRLAATRSTR